MKSAIDRFFTVSQKTNHTKICSKFVITPLLVDEVTDKLLSATLRKHVVFCRFTKSSFFSVSVCHLLSLFFILLQKDKYRIFHKWGKKVHIQECKYITCAREGSWCWPRLLGAPGSAHWCPEWPLGRRSSSSSSSSSLSS